MYKKLPKCNSDLLQKSPKHLGFYSIPTTPIRTLKNMFVCYNTFNNISVISWRSVLLVEETTDLSQVTDKLYHIILYTSTWSKFELTTSTVIGTDCIGSCKSNYHTIKGKAMTALFKIYIYEKQCKKVNVLWPTKPPDLAYF